MVALGYGLTTWMDTIPAGLLAGLKLAVVAVVSQAVWTMANNFCPDRARVSLAVGGAAGTLLIPIPLAPLRMLVLRGCWAHGCAQSQGQSRAVTDLARAAGYCPSFAWSC